MSVVECDVPSESALGKALIERADFRDAYRAPLRRPEAGVIEIFFAIFAHRPVWMNLMLIARNKVAGFAGVETPTTGEILNMEKKGLVRRAQNKEDRRKWHVHLTAKGRALKVELIPLARDVVDTAAQSLSRKEIKQLMDGLAEIQNNLHATLSQLDEISSKMVE